MLSVKQAIIRQEKLLGETYFPPYCLTALNQRFQPGDHCLISLLRKMYGRAGGWEMPDKDTVILTRVITSDGWYAFGATVTVVLHRSGEVNFRCEVKNSSIGGRDHYDYRIAVLITTLSGKVILLRKSGLIDHRGEDILHETMSSPVVAEFFEEFINSWIDTVTDYSSSIVSTIEDGIQLVFSWILGLALIPTQFIGFIIFLGTELGSLAVTGSFETGARIINGTLWMMGPYGTFYAIAGGAVIAIGSNQKELGEEEYNWANQLIFNNTLPPRNSILLTDTTGANHRGFTFPMYGSLITLNMGADGFADPRKYLVNQTNPTNGTMLKYGEVLIHELVHAWQIYHTTLSQTFIAGAFANAVCEQFGVNPYPYEWPPEKPYDTYNLEQQAAIVSDWYNGFFNGGEFDKLNIDLINGANDPRFKYIRDVIQHP